MTVQEFRDYMASGKPIEGGSELHMMRGFADYS